MPDSARLAQNRELVEEFFASLSRRDIDHVMSLMDGEATFWIAGSTPISGSYTKREFERNLREGTPGFRRPAFVRPLQLTITGMTIDVDRVAVEAESYGELEDGSIYRNLYHHLFVLRDRSILRIKEYMDTQLADATWCHEGLRRESA